MWPDAEPTQQLLADIQHGDRDAIDRLLARHREALRQVIERRLDRALARRVDASDVVQDVLMEAHGRLDAYLANPVMPFHLWLRQMASDRIIDLHRRHRVAARRSIDREQPLAAAPRLDQSTIDLAAQLIGHELTPAAAATWNELQRRFAEAVEQLGEGDREIVAMRHFEHLTNGDVATALGLSEQAASMRYLRAMRKLRAALGEVE